jgi:hypothetical protein
VKPTEVKSTEAKPGGAKPGDTPPTGAKPPEAKPAARTEAAPAPAPKVETRPPPPSPPPARVETVIERSVGWPVWVALILLAGAVAWLALRPPPDPGTTLAEARLAGALGSLDRRVAALEAAPRATAAALAPDLGPLIGRLTTAEQRLAEIAARPVATVTATAPMPDLEPLATRIAALENRAAPAPDLGPLLARLAALESRPVPPAAPAPDLGPLLGRLAALESRPAPAPPPAPPAPDLGPLQARLAALEGRGGGASAEQLAALAASHARVRAATAIGHALAAGQPLAEPLRLVQGTPPPALAAFASTAPPTEADLRRDFPAAARAARDAPGATDADAASAVQRFLGGLVTLRRGDRVLLGDGDTTVLAAAESRLQEGALAGALAELGKLSAPAAAAMAPWKTRAEALLAARAALLTLAAG